MSADTGVAGRDHADLLIGAVAQLGADRVPAGDAGRVEAGDVAGELVVLLDPVPDRRQPGTEAAVDHIIGVGDEHRAVAQAGEPRDLLHHLRVVIRGHGRFPSAAVGHRQPADEIGQPGIRCPLQLRVLVQEVVHIPGLIADPQVVVLGGDQVGEHHEVADQDLIHAPQGLEHVQVVLGALGLYMPRLAGQERRRRVDALAPPGQQLVHGMLGQPVDLQVRAQPAQLIGNGQVPPRVTEPDRRGQVQGAAAAVQRPGPPARRAGSRVEPVREIPDRVVDHHRLASLRQVPRALQDQQAGTGQLGDLNLAQKIAELVRDGKISGIANIQDD